MSPMKCLRRSGRGRLTSERGVALVEFALVLPLLLLLVLVIADFGRALAFWNDQTHLANEAARYAVVNSCPGGCADLKAYIEGQAESTTAKVVFCYPLATHNAGDPVHVTVRDTFNWVGHVKVTWLGINWTPAATTMVGNSEMRLEKATNTKYASGLTSYDTVSKTCTAT